MTKKIRSSDLTFDEECQNCGALCPAHGALWGDPAIVLKVSYCDRCHHSHLGLGAMRQGDDPSPAILQLVGHLLSLVPGSHKPNTH
jgi:hypothetical protein